MRGKETETNGISRQNAANNTTTMASAHRFVENDAGVIESNVLESRDKIRPLMRQHLTITYIIETVT